MGWYKDRVKEWLGLKERTPEEEAEMAALKLRYEKSEKFKRILSNIFFFVGIFVAIVVVACLPVLIRLLLK